MPVTDRNTTGSRERLHIFTNSQQAIQATIDYVHENPNGRATYTADHIGLTAIESPAGPYRAYSAPTVAIADDAGVVAKATSTAREAEHGTGQGSLRYRGNASNFRTEWLGSGGTQTVSIELPHTSTYTFNVRYSNDNYGPLETVVVTVDGVQIGTFQAQDTGDNGFGWDQFRVSPGTGPVILEAGTHSVSVTVSGGDGHGVEIDLITADGDAVLRPLEDGTVATYGAGASIIYTPEHATDELWRIATQIDLNQDGKPGLFHLRQGLVDSFNLQVADALEAEAMDCATPTILRCTGAFASFTGFSINHGPLLIMIDNFLEDNFIPQLFMSHPGISHVLRTLFPTWIGPQTGEIHGTVFQDTDANGRQDAGESGLSNHVVYLDSNENGLRDEIETAATTNSSGQFRFTDVPVGTHTVRFEETAFSGLSTPGGPDFQHRVILHVAHEVATADFGVYEFMAWGVADGEPDTDDGGRSVAVDSTGNTYMVASLYQRGDAGNNPGNADILISKVSPTGSMLWKRQVGGASDDRGNGIAVDDQGRVYVTGQFRGSVDFDPGAAELWLTSAGSFDIFVLALNESGEFLWANRFGNTSTVWDIGSEIAVDASGDVIFAGRFGGTVDFDPGEGTAYLSANDSAGDMFIAKFGADGHFVWGKSFGGSSTHGSESVSALVTDDQGNIYAGGRFQGTTDFDRLYAAPGASDTLVSRGTADAFLAKYQPDGQIVWVHQMGGDGSAFELVDSIGVDSSGNVTALGWFQGTAFDPGDGTSIWSDRGSFDVFVTQYDFAGTFQWARQLGGTGNDHGRGIAADSSGNVYVAGFFHGTVDFDPGPSVATLTSLGGNTAYGGDGWIARLDIQGHFSWARQVGGTGEDTIEDLALDCNGHIHIVGWFANQLTFQSPRGLVTLQSQGGTDIFALQIASGDHPPMASDDSATTEEHTPVHIAVLDNDIDVDGTIDLASVRITNQPLHGVLTVDGENGEIVYLPEPGFLGTDLFRYRVADNDGALSDEAQVTVVVAEITARVRVSLAAVDWAGRPVTSIPVGKDVYIQALVEDRRLNAQGVFAAYFDATFDSSLLDVFGPLEFSDDFPNARNSDLAESGLVNEVGATADLAPLGAGRYLLVSIPARFLTEGQVIVETNSADETPAHDMLVFGTSGAITAEDVSFGGLALQSVVSPAVAVSDRFVVPWSTTGVELAVLQNDLTSSGGQLSVVSIGTPNQGGAVQVGSGGMVSYMPAPGFLGVEHFSYTISDGRGNTDEAWVTIVVRAGWQNPTNPLDVNRDGIVSPVDALIPINAINERGPRQLPDPLSAEFSAPRFLDVNGDTFLSAVDPLLVINYLIGVGAGEGESAGHRLGGTRLELASPEPHSLSRSAVVAGHVALPTAHGVSNLPDNGMALPRDLRRDIALALEHANSFVSSAASPSANSPRGLGTGSPPQADWFASSASETAWPELVDTYFEETGNN